MADFPISGGIDIPIKSALTGPAPEAPAAPAAPAEGVKAEETFSVAQVPAEPTTEAAPEKPKMRVDLSALPVVQLDLADFTFEMKTHGNKTGWIIQECVVTTGVFPDNFPRFRGMCEQIYDVQTVKGAAQVRQQLQFSIPGASTIGDAWAFFDGCRQMEKQRLEPFVKQKYEGTAIQVPGQAPQKGRRPF